MSSDSDDLFQDVAQLETYARLNYLTVASICLLYYDYLLTLKDEIRIVWQTRWNIATLLYLSIRYSFLIHMTMGMVLDIPVVSWSHQELVLSSHSCTILFRTATVIQALSFAMVSAFVALRIAALWARNIYIGIVLFVMGLMNTAAVKELLVFGFVVIVAPAPIDRCLATTSTSDTIWLLESWIFPIALSVNSIVYELLCFILTVVKTFGTYRASRVSDVKAPLTWYLLRDGSLYFVVLTALAVYDILAAFALPDSSSTFSRILTPILITRFIARIRKHSQTEILEDTLPTLRFRGSAFESTSNSSHFLDSMGGSLEVAYEEAQL